MRAPPVSSRVASSPITILAMRGDPRYIEALPSTMITRSQKAGMYAPPAADGPKSAQACGTRPDSFTWLWKMRPASSPRKQLHLVGDAGTGGIDQPGDRQLVIERCLRWPARSSRRCVPPRNPP
ncbi:MAG: hypothetical protein R2704_05190 [Microthrixaceae bacterium]